MKNTWVQIAAATIISWLAFSAYALTRAEVDVTLPIVSALLFYMFLVEPVVSALNEWHILPSTILIAVCFWAILRSHRLDWRIKVAGYAVLITAWIIVGAGPMLTSGGT